MSRKALFILIGLVVLIAAGGLGYYFYSGSGDAGASSGQGYELVPTDRTLGNRNSKVVLIEYGAPSCPVCANFNAQSFPELKAKYIDTGKIFYVFRVFPLRPDDGTAEKIARCLPEDKYFSFIDLLFKNQPKWDVEYAGQNPALSAPEGVHDGMVQLARIAGMSAEQADQCMKDTSQDDTINQIAKDGEQKYNITGTPTIVVDGVAQPSGFVAYDTLHKIIDAALAKK